MMASLERCREMMGKSEARLDMMEARKKLIASLERCREIRGQFQIEDDTSIDRQLHLLEVRVKVLLSQRNHRKTALDEIKASMSNLEQNVLEKGTIASGLDLLFEERNLRCRLEMIKARTCILERINSERRLGELIERRNREETLFDGIKATTSNLERMNSEPRVRELIERRKTLLVAVAGDLDGIISETRFTLELVERWDNEEITLLDVTEAMTSCLERRLGGVRETSRLFDHWFHHDSVSEWAEMKFLLVSDKANQNFPTAVVKGPKNTPILGTTGGPIHQVECEEQMAQKEHPPTPLTPDSILPVDNSVFKLWQLLLDDCSDVSSEHLLSCHFFSAANPKTALYFEELGRARALAELMATQYSFEREISCNPHSWTYLDEIMKNECNSTCLYISCYGQEVFLWILKMSGAISLRKITVDNNMPPAKLATNLDAVFANMANSILSEEDCNDQSVHGNEPKPDSSQILTWCYKLLIDPVSGLLEEPSILIVPEGGLCLVPFAALLDDKSGKYLSETFRIRIIPSLTTLKLIQDSPADYHSQTGALVVGDPTVGEVIYRGSVSRKFVPLPGARKEAEMVGLLLGVQPLLGQYATKQVVLQRLMSVSLIHIAAHGNAESGEIALAPLDPTTVTPQEDDYLLTTSDISQVQLRAKLVVLSSCHSACGQIRSEGMIGIAQAFLGSGARSVLVALGALNDGATEQLMCHFYEHLLRGESASESLHQAMKWMRGSGFTKVSDWAPFTLIGDDVTFDFGE